MNRIDEIEINRIDYIVNVSIVKTPISISTASYSNQHCIMFPLTPSDLISIALPDPPTNLILRYV